MNGIGRLNEKPLHAALRHWYAEPGDQLEVEVDGYVIDIVRGGRLLEIQTGNFASLKTKLSRLLCTFEVKLIFPVAQEKWIIKPTREDASKTTRRKSPKTGRWEDLFFELVRFPHFVLNRNFSLEVLLIREEEARRFDGKLGWRRKGWVIEERRLLSVAERKVFERPADFAELIPPALETPFTTADLARSAGIGRPLAQKMAYCLRHMRVIELTGKRKQANLYMIHGT